ncbi:hypothetical protein J6590_038350 [Homalodisca vitripennis]|nr:hypothetical protein J6590_038350 [Homalodisca vitripennis]
MVRCAAVRLCSGTRAPLLRDRSLGKYVPYQPRMSLPAANSEPEAAAPPASTASTVAKQQRRLRACSNRRKLSTNQHSVSVYPQEDVVEPMEDHPSAVAITSTSATQMTAIKTVRVPYSQRASCPTVLS